jgi:hypothetical protein
MLALTVVGSARHYCQLMLIVINRNKNCNPKKIEKWLLKIERGFIKNLSLSAASKNYLKPLLASTTENRAAHKMQCVR